MDVIDQISILKDMDLERDDFLQRRLNLHSEQEGIKQDYKDKRKTTLGLGLMMAYSNTIIHLFSAMTAALLGHN